MSQITFDSIHDPCYNPCKKDGIDMGTNADRVEKYHKQLTNIRVRFPSEEQCGVDYAALIRERALQLGFINQKGKDKGQGSANAYIIHLIEKDLQSAGMIDEFRHDLRQLKKELKED